MAKNKNETDETAEAGEVETATASKLIRVKSGVPSKPNGGDEVVLFERDDRHPGCEAYVAGDSVVEVFPTGTVVSLLRDEKLIQV